MVKPKIQYNISTNPLGCLLLLLHILKLKDESVKKEKLIKWLRFQRCSQASAKNVINDFSDQKISTLDILKSLLIITPEYNQNIISTCKEKLDDFEKAGLVFKAEEFFEITNLGEEILSLQLYKNYFDSTSVIANYWKDRNVKLFRENEKGIGSGFFIDTNKIATCKHVYNELKENLVIEDEFGNTYTLKEVKFHKNENVDLVVLIINESFHKIPFILGNDINLIERVLVFGYPPVPLTTKPFLICNLGEISSIVDNYFEKVDYLVLSCIVKPGNSGGPVIDKFGKVVGIATQNIMEKMTIGDMRINEPIDWNKSMGYSSALPVKYLKEIITCPNIAYKK